MKVMLIGAPAAGKSTYLSATYGRLHYEGIVTNQRRFRVDKSMTLSFNINLLNKYLAYTKGNYPLPDSTFSNYRMNILWDNKPISEIEWIDMAGGDIFNIAKQQETVRRNLRECDAVMAFYAVDNIITNDKSRFDRTVGMIIEMCELIEEEASRRDKPLMVANIFTKADLATPRDKQLIKDQLGGWLTYDGADSFMYFTECVPPELPSPVPMVALIAYSMYIDSVYRGLLKKLRFIKNSKFDDLQRQLIYYLSNELPHIEWWRWLTI